MWRTRPAAAIWGHFMDESEIDIRGLLGLLWRRKRLILGSLLVALGLTALVLFALTPIYSASALVLVDTSRKNLLDPEAQLTGLSSENARVDSEVEILRSESILLRVIEERGLVDDPEFGVRLGLQEQILAFLRLRDGSLPSGPAALQGVLTNVRNAISIQRRGSTYLISVQARSADAQKAAELANALAEAYIADQVASKVGNTLASRDVLQARIEQARQAIIASEESFDSFIARNIDTVVDETGRADLAEMRREIEQLDATRSETAALADRVRSDLAGRNWQSIAEALQSDAIAALEQQRTALANSLDAAAENTPAAVDLRAELARIEQSLAERAQTEVSLLQQSLSVTDGRQDDLRQQIRATVLAGNLSADALTRIYELQQNAELARNQYQTLLARVNELDAQADLQIADSRIVSPALAPAQPSFPNNVLMLALAAAAGLGLGVALAFLYENYIGGFASEEQVQAVLKTPVASAVPRQKLPARLAGDGDAGLADLMVSAPLSIFAEAVRRLRAGIDQALRGRVVDKGAGGTVVMVSSTAPGEGKSTLAIALARSYALSGQKVLLVDCDLRKPSVHRQLGLEPNSSLVDFLSSGTEMDSLSELAIAEDTTGARIVLGARRSDVPTDQLVAGKRFARLLELARRDYDVVVLDTPPVGPVVDGLYIARAADVIAFVIRWANTSQSDARKAVAALDAAKAPSTQLLTVLNQQERSQASYHQKYAGYYSEVT